MALLSRQEIEAALTRLGQLADQSGATFEFLVVGGAAMVLAFDARPSTHDVDAVVLPPGEASTVRQLVETVGIEFGWPLDWLNDGAKGFLSGQERGQLLFESLGIRVFCPPIEQLLAMKLCAWRDDVDIDDATLLLRILKAARTRDLLWDAVVPYLVPGRELKAQLAFQDLWEAEA